MNSTSPRGVPRRRHCRSGVGWAGFALATAAAFVVTVTSCKVGPNYTRPGLNVPATYKGDTQPAEHVHLITNWWELFGDEDLNHMEEEAIRNNPDLQAAMQRVAQARAAAGVVESQYYPTITFDPSITHTDVPGGLTISRASAVARSGTSVRVPFDLGYEVDLWGQVARSMEAANATTRATAEQFAVIMQTLEADVAQNYLTLRSLEDQDEIFDKNVQISRDQIALTRRKQQAGIVGQLDIAQAQVVLDEQLAQQVEIRRQRADTEHALSILLGRPPAEFSVARRPFTVTVPVIPPGLPADLLRHRPDVAVAEENLIAANAQVGVAISQYYPALRLTGLAGFEAIDVQHAMDWQSAVLSLTPSLSVPIFEGGRLTANLEQSRARYQELVATFRSTLLTAFRDVEVSLTDVHMRAEALVAQDHAVESAQEYLRLARVQYNQGIISQFQVLDAQRTLLTDELTESQLRNARLVSTVLLIKALGGGWDPAYPTSRPAVQAATQPLP